MPFRSSAHTICVSETLFQSGKVDRITRSEADAMLLRGQDGIVEPEEVVPFAEQSADLAVSLFAFHEINDLPGYLAQIRRVLKPDGLLLAAFSGCRYARRIARMSDCGGNGTIGWRRSANLSVHGCTRRRCLASKSRLCAACH